MEVHNLARSRAKARYAVRRYKGKSLIEPPEIANRSLSDEEAETYENAVKRTIENFEALWNEDYSGDID